MSTHFGGRTLARSQALQLLFQAEANSRAVLSVLDGDYALSEGPLDDYARRLALGADEARPEIDAVISTRSASWSISRMNGVDRNLLRLAIYEMLYVVNRYRILSTKPEETLPLLREIEGASHLKATAVVNNSHLGVDTTQQTVLDAVGFAEESARLCGLPLLYSTIPDFAAGEEIPAGFKVVRRYVHFVWEDETDF